MVLFWEEEDRTKTCDNFQGKPEEERKEIKQRTCLTVFYTYF